MKTLFFIGVLCIASSVQAGHTCTKISCKIERIVTTTIETTEQVICCIGSRSLAAPTRGVQRRVARRSDRRHRKIERWVVKGNDCC